MTQPIPKPLPNTPVSPALCRLTVESNALIGTFIQSVVDEERLDDSWAATIEGALVDFGEYLEAGEILPGLKLTRKTQNHTRVLEDARQRKERESSKGLKTGKGKGNDKIKETDVAEVEAPSQSEEEKRNLRLAEICALTSTDLAPISMSSSQHLFLTVAPYSATSPDPESDFDLIPAPKACSFNPETYSFPFYEDQHGRHGEGGVVISGLDNWKTDEREASPQKIVGGTFTFYNLSSDTAYSSLVSLLKLSVYMYLSLVLEQHVLSNSHVILQYPPPPSRPSPTPLSTPATATPPLITKQKSRANKASSSIWSFLSRKTGGIIHRVAGANAENTEDPPSRGSSLDIRGFSSSKSPWRTPRSSEDSQRPVVTVAEAESGSRTIKASRARVAEEHERRDRERWGPFASTVRRLQNPHCVLSTSPNVTFPLPPLIVRLAQREEEQRQSGNASSSSGSSLSSSTSSVMTAVPGSASGPLSLRLTGVEKTGLGSILGWEGREARGHGMVGIRSFVRHQSLTVLYAERVPDGESETLPCGRPRWITFRYWVRAHTANADRDRTLGEMVEHSCEVTTAEELCEMEGCVQPRGRHSMNWTCGGVRVQGIIKENTDDVGNKDTIEMWQTCALCGKRTEQVEMDDGSYLFSFAKFLELLIWSPILASLSLCEHTSSPSPSPQTSDPSLSDSRFHILRHFAFKGHVLTLSLASVHDDIYEIRLPKLQITSGSMHKEEKQLSEARKRREGEEERFALGTEIDDWWQGVKTRLDKLEEFFEKEARQALESKDLPPLPSSDDEDSEDDEIPSRAQSPSPGRPQAPRSVSFPFATIGSLTPLQRSRPSSPGLKNRKPVAPYPPGLTAPRRESRQLLEKLRASLQNTEDSLRKQVSETPISSLNDVRRTFRSAARGVFKRLAAWQKKHAPGVPVNMLGNKLTSTEPEWWSSTCHLVPGGRVVVREGEWGSVIAFTLSSLDYQRELGNLNAIPGPSSSPAPSTNTVSELPTSTSNATVKYFKSTIRNPDPDENDTAVWEESEPWTAVITRREHPRDVSTLLSLRDVLRNKRSSDSPSLGSRFTGSLSRGAATITPPSAWAQPQVQVNLEAADGQVSQFPEAAKIVEKVLESQYPIHHHADTTLSSEGGLSASGEATPTPSGFVERHIRSGDALSVISFERPVTPITLSKTEPTVITTVPVSAPSEEHGATPSNSSFSGALSSAMRYFLNTSPPSRSPSPAPAGTHHGLLALETSSIDDRPHIKYDWTIGKRMKFSCTVYYAKQFDTLRKRCGVDDVIIKSLERSANWTAVGGKSKSNFWKTSDDRFVIKTLVNAWNVADLQVLIELAPSYFRYMDSTASKASVLAKLMGFYTVEVKNLDTGSTQAKHDLLVMENLFYNQKVARTFDLKGIQSRRVKPSEDGTERRTLFDGEWIEDQQRMPLLIQPYSRHILQEAIRGDADFLAKSNIMDYSLLLGIDEERHEILCGLVDAIGSYTFAKTLEYKAKQNLNSGKGKEVTVIPPAEYHSRFITSMESYFFACPDKWTKPPYYVDRTEANDLASVV